MRLTWDEEILLEEKRRVVHCWNDKKEHLGFLLYERVGAHMHWCWYQEHDVRMSPGCLQEVREKQKELLRERNGKER